MSHGNSKGERRENGVEPKYEDCKKMTVKVQLTFLSGLDWRSRTQRWKTGLGPLPESRQEDEGPDADCSWESGRKWTNLRSKVGDADWTRPPTWALVSQPHPRGQSLPPRKQLFPVCSVMEQNLTSPQHASSRFRITFEI